MSGITLSFDKITKDYLNLPIRYIQILFQNGRNWIDPTDNELFNLRTELQQRKIRPIIHINIQIQITNLTGQYLSRVKQEIYYGRKLNAEYIIIHCGTKGQKRTIPKSFFKDRLNHLISISPIPVLLENSASIKCYGTTLEELKDLTNQSNIGGIVYDTMHHYAAGNNWDDLWKILEDPVVKVIHVNNIPKDVIFRSGQDKHESLDIGKMKDFDRLKRIDKIKILETPNHQKWINELQVIQTKIAEFETQNYSMTKINGYRVYVAPTKIGHVPIEAAIDTGAEITCISQKTIEKLKREGYKNIIYVPNPGIRIKQAASVIGETEWIKIPITISKYTKKVIISIINGQFRELLIGLDILKGNKDQNNGYIVNLPKGEMYGNNEVIRLTERKNIHLQEILTQEITKNDILFQIWKKGKFAKDDIILKISDLTNQINDLKEKYGNESILIPSRSRWSHKPKIKELKQERNLWEDALLELEEKEIQNKSKKEAEQQAKEIENFFKEKQFQIEREKYEQKLKERQRENEDLKQQIDNQQESRNYNPNSNNYNQESLYEKHLRLGSRSRSRKSPIRSRSRSRRSPIRSRSRSRRLPIRSRSRLGRTPIRSRSRSRKSP